MSTNAEQRLQQQVDELMIQLAASEEARKIAQTERDGWMDSAKHFADASTYYSSLIDKCAAHIGLPMYTADDYGVSEEPLRAKIVECVADIVQRAEAAEKLIEDSRKQEPYAYVGHKYAHDWASGGKRIESHESLTKETVNLADSEPLYKQPPIPPELSEVMRERDELKRLLSEARKVPEGWIDAVMEQAQVFASSWSILGSGSAFEAPNQLELAQDERAKLRAMLSASPTYKEQP